MGHPLPTFVGRARFIQCRPLGSGGTNAIHEMVMKGPAFQARQGDGSPLVMSVLSCFQCGKGHRPQAHLAHATPAWPESGPGRRSTPAIVWPHGTGMHAGSARCQSLEACRGAIDVGAQEERRAVRAGLDTHADTHVALARHLVDHLGGEAHPLSAGRHPLHARPLRPLPLAVRWRADGQAGTWRTILARAAGGRTAPWAKRLERYGPDTLEAFAVGCHRHR